MARITLRIDGTAFEVDLAPDRILVDGVETAPPRRSHAVASGDTRWVFVDGEVYEFEVQRPGRRGASSHHASLSAPMPATVRRINVVPGARVSKGDTLLVLEAMKMELPVRAPDDGVVTAVSCKEGDLVQAGVPLLEIE
jgi:biotin carboxyl carrier protein